MTGNDFWDFYLRNKSKIDTIIFAQTRRFQGHLNLDDMKQEILLRLEQNDFLATYNSAQSGIFTHLTNKVRGYAWHLYTQSLGRPWKPTLEEEYIYQQVLFPSINGISDYQDANLVNSERELTADQETWEEEFSCQEILAVAKRRLSAKQGHVLDMLVEGLKLRDIAEALEITRQAAGCHVRAIRNRLIGMREEVLA